MTSTVVVAALALIGLLTLKALFQLRRNIAEAKASGIPYIVLPVFQNNRAYQIACLFILPALRALPSALTEPWLDLTLEWGWNRRYEPFARLGTDTFLAVSPGRIQLNTAEASVIEQITTRRSDFPKPTELYGSLTIYGTNVVSTEGAEWRHHRKITSPPFSEKNNMLVWEETLSQTGIMVGRWFGQDKDRSSNIRTISEDTMRLSLHIISKAGFDVNMAWPSQSVHGEPSSASELKDGHKMTYTQALGTVLHNIIPIIAMPRWLLINLPLKSTTTAYTAFVEWGRYMKEMYEEKKAKILAGDEVNDNDLMIAMLKGAGVTANQGNQEKAITQSMTDEEILGNAFVFLLAGHESTSNSLHFSLVYLAMNIASQRRLQKDIDETFEGRSMSEWSYEQDVPKLFGNMAGAVLNEELRLLPPVTAIPKCTKPGKPQLLTVGGKQYTVPANTYISLVSHAAHRNPNQWPSGPPADLSNPSHPYSNPDNDLEEFKPERWILKDGTAPLMQVQSKNDEGIDLAPDTSPALYKPSKGAYIPFSEGYRSCIGRRFAQVELLAFLAYVFSQYSVELSVEEWASDEQLEKMDDIGKREAWGKAKAKIEHQMIYDMASVITLQLRKGHIPLKLVKRGKEIFDWK